MAMTKRKLTMLSLPIKRLSEGLDVAAVLAALEQCAGLWNQHTERTAHPSSPHHGLDDIWVRYAPPDIDPSVPHDAVWYPSPLADAIKPLVYALMNHVRGDHLGGVLITRIPPGAQCKPHTDPGWHARYYEKFAVQLKAHAGQKFCFDTAQLETKQGDLFWFDNSQRHWVTNDTPHERVTLIVCIRPDGKG